jgi:hypothetical protein
MPDDARFAAAARDDGLRRVRRLTFQIGAAALACSAGIAVAFGHLSGASASKQASNRPGSSSTGSGSTGSRTGPAGSSQPGSGSFQPPAQNVQSAAGPVQGVSGGS